MSLHMFYLRNYLADFNLVLLSTLRVNWKILCWLSVKNELYKACSEQMNFLTNGLEAV